MLFVLLFVLLCFVTTQYTLGTITEDKQEKEKKGKGKLKNAFKKNKKESKQLIEDEGGRGTILLSLFHTIKSNLSVKLARSIVKLPVVFQLCI